MKQMNLLVSFNQCNNIFIQNLDVNEDIKEELMKINVINYI